TRSLCDWSSDVCSSDLCREWSYHKNFYTTIRDSISPNPGNWSIHAPAAGSLQSVQISFPEALDYVLLSNTMRIVDESNKEVKGAFHVSNNETVLKFVPGEAWKAA